MVLIVNGYYGSGKTFYCKNNYHQKEIISIDSMIIKRLDNNQIKNNVLYSIVLNKEKTIVLDFYFKQSWIWLLEEIKNFCLKHSIELYEINMNHFISIEESYKRFCNRNKFNITFDEYKNICEIN